MAFICEESEKEKPLSGFSPFNVNFEMWQGLQALIRVIVFESMLIQLFQT